MLSDCFRHKRTYRVQGKVYMKKIQPSTAAQNLGILKLPLVFH